MGLPRLSQAVILSERGQPERGTSPWPMCEEKSSQDGGGTVTVMGGKGQRVGERNMQDAMLRPFGCVTVHVI